MSADPTVNAAIYDEVRAERIRAHAKHGRTSMEETDPLDLMRLAILMEEVGEVAEEFNEHRHKAADEEAMGVMPFEREQHLRAWLRKELIQVAAMATAWADVL